MKISQIHEFKKLPTSENEERIEHQELNENINLLKSIWFLVFIIAFAIIFIFWLSAELYYIFYQYNIIEGNLGLSIIININNKKQNLTNILRTLSRQSFSSYELIITKNFHSNFSELSFSKFKRGNTKIRFIQYNEKDTNLKIRIDSVSESIGDYILFLDPDDYFSENILGDCFATAINKKIDIIQFKHFHDNQKFDVVLEQPRLFDSIYFNIDMIEQKQFHLSGKIIKKEIFIKSMKGIDNFYLQNNNIYFEDSMIIYKLFKNAKTFIKIKETKKLCKKKVCALNLLGQYNYSKEEIKDILMYLKFLIQYTEEKVLEKRMASKLFLDFLVDKPQTKKDYDRDLIILLDEVVNLFSKCELINEYDIKLINDYRNIISIY